MVARRCRSRGTGWMKRQSAGSRRRRTYGTRRSSGPPCPVAVSGPGRRRHRTVTRRTARRLWPVGGHGVRCPLPGRTPAGGRGTARRAGGRPPGRAGSRGTGMSSRAPSRCPADSTCSTPGSRAAHVSSSARTVCGSPGVPWRVGASPCVESPCVEQGAAVDTPESDSRARSRPGRTTRRRHGRPPPAHAALLAAGRVRYLCRSSQV